ncbi:hypothetical protein K3495_g5637 [Podosphaera aphanis]|nr:hypothetical protein K3495_g5637 [Podosphaera aphanis]
MLIYNAIVKPALISRSPIWAETGTRDNIPERIVNPLRSIQRKHLKLGIGAYKSTSSRVLEHESSVFPIEIYPKQRRVQQAGLSDKLPVEQTILSVCSKIKLPASEREIPHVRIRSKDDDEWIRICGKETNRDRQKEAGRVAAFQEWANSWANNRLQRSGRQTTADPESWNAAKIITDQQTSRKRLNFKGTPSNTHLSLSKAQSSVATQIRSEHIGLNSYLYRRKVPGVHDPSCQCGYPSQNVKHMVVA